MKASFIFLFLKNDIVDTATYCYYRVFSLWREHSLDSLTHSDISSLFPTYITLKLWFLYEESRGVNIMCEKFKA